ncbi:cytochrome C oxidase subunit III [Opitutaceae bacterium EW11]|nr:cytochrome C oxidase subunit III [Opitutaceae bacterium EW11]
MSTPLNPNSLNEEPVRPHSYDGIREFDKRLPNWWLLTFYGTIVFAIGYWFYYAHTSLAPSPNAAIEAKMAQIQSTKLASSPVLDDDVLWKMSRTASMVEAGAATFKSTCVSCHGEKLTGGVGPNLVDQTWIHGGRPTQILATVTNGVAAKGMPTWGPVLGGKRISEVVSFILSKHDPAEPGMGAQTASTNPYNQP